MRLNQRRELAASLTQDILRWTFLCLLTICAGCVKRSAYHLGEVKPQVQFDYPPASRQLPSIPVNPRIDHSQIPSVVTVEFSESGNLFDCDSLRNKSPVPISDNCQVKRATEYLAAAGDAVGAQRELVVITFVHGWHHNASWSSENFINFQRTIDCLDWGASEEEKLYANAPHTKATFLCEGIQKSERIRYVGVYIGWRGESILPAAGILTHLSIISRRNDATKVAEEGDLLKTLDLLNRIAKGGRKPARTILVGHSFGGLIVSRIVSQKLMPAFEAGDFASVGPCGDGSVGHRGFADLTVLINPADNALRISELADEMKEAEEKKKNDVAFFCNAESPAALPRPVILSIHTTTDSATEILLSWLMKVAFRIDSDYSNRRMFEWKEQMGESPPTFHERRTNAINKIDFLRNLCYLDQENGGDSVCVDVNDEILKMKERAYLSVIGTLPENPRYDNESIFSNGAWELLTSVCWEAGEEPAKQDPNSPSAFPQAVPCKENPLLEVKRQRLAVAFRRALAPLLAFPNATNDVHGNSLLDVYRRVKLHSCDLTNSEDPLSTRCNKIVSAWNNTPFWSLDISYENVQNHSNFWNADVFALITEVVSQFPVLPPTSDKCLRDVVPGLPSVTVPRAGR